MDDNFDKQALGIAHTDPGMNGVLRVSLNLKRGLVIADFVNDVSLEYWFENYELLINGDWVPFGIEE